MKVLLYNWVHFDDIERRGGGVRVYEQNLVDHLVSNTDDEIYVFSSGLEHDFFDRRMVFESSENVHGDRVRSFRFVNSPVLAPGHAGFGTDHLFDEEALACWHAFLREHGPFDVIQFDSLEGIPLNFLRVHEVHPQTKVLLYAHNYYAVCPQVNLWKLETQHCDDFHDGRDCVTCVPELPNPNYVLRAQRLSRLLRKVGVMPGTRRYRFAYRLYSRAKVNSLPFRLLRAGVKGVMSRSASDDNVDVTDDVAVHGDPSVTVTSVSLKRAGRFSERRSRAVELINEQVDTVLATSHRVKDVLANYGIERDRITVSYIGTKVAEEPEVEARRHELRIDGQITMAFLGYMRRDKGFYFLVDALERAPDEFLANLRLVVAAGGRDPLMVERLESLADRMADIVHYDGYSHEQLPAILADVDVGVVPVQWEDNLPQVAIEMVAQGIPIITSDRGGAQEVGGSHDAFTFDATSRRQLIEILRSILEGETKLGDYWDRSMKLVTMDSHASQLRSIYGEATPA